MMKHADADEANMEVCSVKGRSLFARNTEAVDEEDELYLVKPPEAASCAPLQPVKKPRRS